MARSNGIFCLVITAVLIVFFFTFSGCSDSINSPFSPDNTAGDFELSGSHKSFKGQYPNDEWESARDSRILQTREGEIVSAADVVLEYNPDDFPPGLEPWVHFGNPRLYEFTIMPPGIVKNRSVRVIVDYSRADLDGVIEENIQAYGAEGGEFEVLDTGVDPTTNRATFKTTEFARYALARD